MVVCLYFLDFFDFCFCYNSFEVVVFEFFVFLFCSVIVFFCEFGVKLVGEGDEVGWIGLESEEVVCFI